MSSGPAAPVESGAFTDAQYAALLGEARAHLPLYLAAAARERRGHTAVEAIGGLEAGELRQVVSTHLCLSEQAGAFTAALRCLQAPAATGGRALVRSRAIDGPISWAATARARAAAGGDPGLFVTVPALRRLDASPNRTLAWVVEQLDRRASAALRQLTGSSAQTGWATRIAQLRAEVRDARRRLPWLASVAAAPPGPDDYERLAATRSRFYAVTLARMARTLQTAGGDDEAALTQLLCERWFEPDKAWRLYEVVVALRLARAFDRHAGCARSRRLLTGSERCVYARYALDDGDEIELVRAGWPPGTADSHRVATARRHDFAASPSKPDLVVRRSGRRPDCVVLELKATRRRQYLAEGLDQLLRYLSDQPGAFERRPAGWLVAPASQTYAPCAPDDDAPLWIATADEVADAAVARMIA